MRRLLLAASLVLVASCSSDPETERRTAAEHGRDLFGSTKTSNSALNVFSCATCHHADRAADDGRVLPGFDLAGAVDRPTFWGGQRRDLLLAINDCRYYFMSASVAWTAEDEDAKAMYAFLASLPKKAPNALPFTIVPVAQDLPPSSDKARGEQVFEQSCRSCHGAAHTGRGRLRSGIPMLPEEEVQALTSLFGFSREEVRVTFIEKVRHGGFLGVFGAMPPYATEAMSDADLAAVLAFLDLY